MNRPLHPRPGQHRREQGRAGQAGVVDGQAGPAQHLLHHGQQEARQQAQEESARQVLRTASTIFSEI